MSSPARDGALGGDDGGRRSPEVHGAGAREFGIEPRDRPVERPVDLEDPRPVAPAGEPARVAGRQGVAGHREHLSRGEVEQHRACGGQFGERAHAVPGAHLAAEGFEPRDQRIRERLGTADGDGPSDTVRESGHEHGDAGGEQGAQREDRVRGEAGEEGAGRLLAEGGAHRQGRGPESVEPEREEFAGRVGRQRGRVEHGSGEPLPALAQPAEDALPAGTVASEPGRRLRCRAVQQHRPTRSERVTDRDRRMRELQPVAVEGERAERGRGERERQHGRAHVVPEAGKGELLRAERTSGDRGRLEHEHTPAGLGEGHRRDETVRPRADHHGVDLGHPSPPRSVVTVPMLSSLAGGVAAA